MRGILVLLPVALRYSVTYDPPNTVWLGAWKDGYRDYAVGVDAQRGPTLDLALVRR